MDPKTRQVMGLGLIAGLALGGCGGGPGGEAPERAASQSTGEARPESAAVAGGATPAGEPEAGQAEGRAPTGADAEAGEGGDAAPAEREADEAAETAGRPDTPREATTGGQDTTAAADTVHVGRYFVRLRPTADPDSVAARHGIEPIRVIREPARAFYASLDRGQHRALEADSMVTSLAIELNDVPDSLRRKIQGVEIPPRGGDGG